MNRIVTLFFIVTILTSACSSSKKQLRKGNYDAAIEKAVKQLRKDPADVKQMDIMIQSYKIANEQDNEKIRFLKMEGRPDSWDEIYLVYKALNDRQSLVRTVTPLKMNGKSVDFPYIDYLKEIVVAKRKAADFYYTHGTELMKNGLKESYRQAFAEFLRAKQYVGDYEGIDNKMQDAKFMGMSRVFISLRNSSIIRFQKEFEQYLLALDLPSLNSEWVEFYTQDLDKNIRYDYYINVNIRNVAVSRDQTLERTKSKPLPFPNDFEMISRCSESLKRAIRGVIQNDRRFIY